MANGEHFPDNALVSCFRPWDNIDYGCMIDVWGGVSHNCIMLSAVGGATQSGITAGGAAIWPLSGISSYIYIRCLGTIHWFQLDFPLNELPAS